MRKAWVALGLLIVPIVASAQGGEHDLRTLLQDSSYIFNRFEESTSGLDVEINSWNVRASTKEAVKREFAGVLDGVRAEKPTLNALLLKNDVSATDLFDVYYELNDIASELDSQSSMAADWGDSAKAKEFSQLGNRTIILAGKVGVALREKIQSQEAQLAVCSANSPLSSGKHK